MVPEDDVGTPHDALFGNVFGNVEHAAALLASVLPRSLVAKIDLGSLRLSGNTFRDRGLRSTHADLIFEANIAGRRGFVVFLVEHQSAGHGAMPLRLLGYMVRIWEREHAKRGGSALPPIVPVVVSHEPGGWRRGVELIDLLPDMCREADLSPFVPNFRFCLEDLAQVSDAQLQSRAMAAIARLALWALRDGRSPGQILRKLDVWADALTDAANAPDGRDALAHLFRYISTVAEELPFDTLEQAVAQLTPAAEETMSTIAEELKARGREEAREEMRTMAAELEAKGRREILTKQLVLKFGPLPVETNERIAGATSEQLDLWLERVLTAGTIDEVVH